MCKKCAKTCGVCQGPLRSDNESGFCRKTSACRTAHGRKARAKWYAKPENKEKAYLDLCRRRGVSPNPNRKNPSLCRVCNRPLRRSSTWTVCRGRHSTEACRKEYYKEYYQRNHVKARKSTREWYQKNRKRILESLRMKARVNGSRPRHEMRGENHPMHKSGRECHCRHCGKSLGFRSAGSIKRNKFHFCMGCRHHKMLYFGTKKCKECGLALHPRNKSGYCNRSKLCYRGYMRWYQAQRKAA